MIGKSMETHDHLPSRLYGFRRQGLVRKELRSLRYFDSRGSDVPNKHRGGVLSI